MKTSSVSLAATLAVLAVGCTPQTGKITVLLKDAPDPTVSWAWVNISQIDLIGSGGTTVLATNVINPRNLLELANDTATLVKDVEVPAGTYGQLRFVISGGCIEANGVVYSSAATCEVPDAEGGTTKFPVGGTLRMPSYAQSGLKIDLPGNLGTVGTDTTIVLVDFDVKQSFGHVAGGSGAWVMHPVVKATDFRLTGTVNVSLALGPEVVLPGTNTLASFSVVLAPAAGGTNTLLPLVGTNTLASASFRYLVPGDYTLDFNAPSGVNAVYSPTVPRPVTVTSGQATAASFVLMSAH